jgi:hypothetical protein
MGASTSHSPVGLHGLLNRIALPLPVSVNLNSLRDFKSLIRDHEQHHFFLCSLSTVVLIFNSEI